MTNHHLPSPQVKVTRALVIGGGIAGLIAARVLSDYYDQVQIVERDLLLEQPNLRAGTPQAFHIHRVVGRGQSCLDRLFPNFTSELIGTAALNGGCTEDPLSHSHNRLLRHRSAFWL